MEINENGFEEVSRKVETINDREVETIVYQGESIVSDSEETTRKLLVEKFLPKTTKSFEKEGVKKFFKGNWILSALKNDRLSFNSDGLVSYIKAYDLKTYGSNAKPTFYKVLHTPQIKVINTKGINFQHSERVDCSETILKKY